MIFRALDANNDWCFGAGRQSYLKDNDAIMKNIETKLLTFSTECFFNTAVGLPWFDLIDMKNKDIIVLTIKSAIAECEGVIRVNELQYDWTLKRELTIKYGITTLYETNVLGTVTI